MPGELRITFFGTFDEHQHPRVRVLREGLTQLGHEVDVVNVPLGLDTASRVRLAAQPWRMPLLALRLIATWTRLLWLSRRTRRPDVVVVGYMGHLDVHLARLRWPRSHVVVDHMISLADTVRDRGIDRGLVARLLGLVDRAATRQADTVLLDTIAQLDELPTTHRDKALVVPVGAPKEWFDVADPDLDTADVPPPEQVAATEPVRVVFFGLYTPLQGAPTIGEAIAKVGSDNVRWTMIGDGQDRAATEAAAGDTAVTWLDWVKYDDLPGLVAEHDVCLGIFDTGSKARRVVPNKVFQGAAAGCAVVTSDTAPQRDALGDAAVYVAPGDAAALARAITDLAENRVELWRLRRAAHKTAVACFTPAAALSGLSSTLLAARTARRPAGQPASQPRS